MAKIAKLRCIGSRVCRESTACEHVNPHDSYHSIRSVGASAVYHFRTLELLHRHSAQQDVQSHHKRIPCILQLEWNYNRDSEIDYMRFRHRCSV